MMADAVFLGVISLGSLIATAWGVKRAIRSLHMLQLDSYSNYRLMRWLGSSLRGRLFAPQLAGFLTVLMLTNALVDSGRYAREWCLLSIGIWVCGGGLLLAKKRPFDAKKPLIYTGRAKRILGMSGIILTLIAIVGTAFAAYTAAAGAFPRAAFIALASSLVLTQLSPLAVILANIALWPVQVAINQTFLSAAKLKVKRTALVVIGITGSYGKTSTKNFMATILREKFDVLATPHSFNTLLGISRTINDDLKENHQIFVVEMGAYRRGDIRELCDLVAPKIGVLTAIGPQHLERFKKIENIERAKYELIESLPKDGLAVFNGDDERCARLADRTSIRTVRYGTDSDNVFVRAEGIKTSADGLNFTIVVSDGRRVDAKTRLLGKHNVSNILAAVCVALELGMDAASIAAGIEKLAPVPHRLELIRGAGGVVVIDDSYNSNPKGAAAALAALAEFRDGRRILITPGMIELGDLQESANQEFGALAAGVCDFVVLVGNAQTLAIQRGLSSAGMASDRVRVVRDLSEATAWLRETARPGDAVLFENDLPDLYTDRA